MKKADTEASAKDQAEKAEPNLAASENASDEETEESGLTAVQVQILKIIAAMLIATVVVLGGALVKRKFYKKEN